METFEFVTDDDFRAALESDFAEMENCRKGEAWKAVVVLAGSIVEAILADSLIVAGYAKKDPLKLELWELISTCRAEGIVSDRAVDLCTVIRSYRNLIHPGRAIRLRDTPDRDAATIASSVVSLIAKEVATKRAATYGPTAAQLASKLEEDHGAVHILPHLLSDMSERERERLVMKVLPERILVLERERLDYIGSIEYPDELDSVRFVGLEQLSACYRRAFEAATDSVKKKALASYVATLKGGTEIEVGAYDGWMFQCLDLSHIDDPNQKAIAKDHALSVMQRGWPHSREFTRGLVWHLEIDDVARWVAPIMRTLMRGPLRDSSRQLVGECLNEALAVEGPLEKRMVSELTKWRDHLQKHGHTDGAQLVTAALDFWKEPPPF